MRPIHEGAWYVHPGLLSALEEFVAVNRVVSPLTFWYPTVIHSF